MLDGTYYFECACGSVEHTLRFSLDKDDPPIIYGDIYLSHYIPWYKRIYVAFKYIFKISPHHNHFDNWIMRKEDALKMIDMCSDFLDEGEDNIDYLLLKDTVKMLNF